MLLTTLSNDKCPLKSCWKIIVFFDHNGVYHLVLPAHWDVRMTPKNLSELDLSQSGESVIESGEGKPVASIDYPITS